MKVFVCNDHYGHWPVPTASVIVAENEEDARDLLELDLYSRGIHDNRFTLTEVDTNQAHVIMLSDGEY